jgi:tetratricopeptide (TPR) repeat protein
LRGVTRPRLLAALAAAGGRLVRRPSSRVSLVALGHSSAPACLGDGIPIRFPESLPDGVELVSECEVKRRLGLASPQPDVQRQLSTTELARAADLDAETLRTLDLYDVLDGEGGQFGFRDLRSAREAKRLLDRGFTIVEIVEATLALRAQGRGLFDTSLSDTPWGEILQHATGRLARLDGQYLLPFEETFQSADELFERAEECETAGDLVGAERLYRQAGAADPSDPVIPFNLGNVLDELGQPQEAALAYQRAIARDAAFAEAWVNLARLHERSERNREAERCLRRALEARRDYADALFSLASLLTRQDRYGEALPLWENFIARQSSGRETDRVAHRHRSLCRLATAVPEVAASRDGPSIHDQGQNS